MHMRKAALYARVSTDGQQKDYANGRFTKIETTVEWLKEILLEVKARLEQGTVQHEGDLSSRISSPHRRAKRHSRR
jgi:predicted site-specific integrase-resolvase